MAVNDPLQTLYQLMSGRQPIAVKECADLVSLLGNTRLIGYIERTLVAYWLLLKIFFTL